MTARPGDTGPMPKTPTKAAGRSAAKAAPKSATKASTKPATKASSKPAKASNKPPTKRAAAGSSSRREFAWEATADELAALDAMTKDGVWTVGGFELKLTNLDKVIFPPRDEEPVTKRDLIRYFALIAPTMLPHLQERPLNFQRFPNGPNAPGFWQKDIPGTAPAWLRRWKEVGVEEREANDHLIADRVGALCWLGNQTSFEIHAWTSRIDDPMTRRSRSSTSTPARRRPGTRR